MIIRKLRANERYKSDMVSAVAFEWGMDYLKAKAEAEAMTPEEIAEKDKAPEVDENSFLSDRFRESVWAALDDDDSTVFGAVIISNYTVNFDGHTTLMGGVGGVSTLPHCRRQGAIRECMRAALADMNENGFDFSFLYPFSRAYYRQFGYENGAMTRVYTLNFYSLKKYDIRGSIDMLLPGDDLSVLTELYNKYYGQFNLNCARHSYDKSYEEAKFLEKLQYIYVWRNESGEPRGFMSFRKVDGVMDCTYSFSFRGGFVFLDRDALCGMLDFAQKLAPHYHAIKFALPDNRSIDAIISEGNDIECSLQYNGMARVVNVERVLKQCRCRGQGSLNIAVSDKMCAWNNGVWRLSYSPDRPNGVALTDEAADIELDINMFTSLILGITSADDIPYMPMAKLNNQDATVGDVFYKKLCLCSNLF